MGLVFHLLLDIPFRPLFLHYHGWVVDIQGLLGEKCVATGALRVGYVPLSQDHYHVLHLSVHKVDP